MYSFIAGNIAKLAPTQVTLENQGIGYEIEISLKTFELIKERKEVKLYIQQIVREDGHFLFGFHDEIAKSLFKKLIMVSGIGPNTARLILSGMSVPEIVRAIRQESDLAFKKVKGVGPKTAKRIILDLKDKILDLGIDDVSGSNDTIIGGVGNTVFDEALSALIALGFRRPQVVKAVENAISKGGKDARVEEVIKLSLKTLTGG
jgi:Holliday junction DNA helicase RuvA